LNEDLVTILALKRVLQATGEGMGIAQSVVRELRAIGPLGTESGRLILLGLPLSAALRPLTGCRSDEVSTLATLVLYAPRSSSAVISRSGGALASTLEKWVKAKESARLQQKALRFRGFITSAVLGAVSAMIASLGPLVGSLDFGASAPINPAALQYCAACMVALSSCMLGLFMSGRGFYVNVVVSLAVFALVSTLAAPLASLSPVTLWGVK